MKTTDFREQIRLLSSSQNIFIDYGYSFMVNCLFCRNSTIFITDMIESQTHYKWCQIAFSIISKMNNKFVFIDYLTYPNNKHKINSKIYKYYSEFNN